MARKKSEQYIAKQGDGEGLPIPGMRATAPDALPEIDDYNDVADLPTVYNELAGSTQAALLGRMTPASPSAAAGVTGFRRITISTSGPTGGVDGDIWFQREA